MVKPGDWENERGRESKEYRIFQWLFSPYPPTKAKTKTKKQNETNRKWESHKLNPICGNLFVMVIPNYKL